MKPNQYTIIDLFAGTSALSEGFINNGFIPLAHIEMDKNACDTIRTRVAYHYLRIHRKLSVYRQYLKGEITREQLYKQIPQEWMSTVINREISDNSVPDIIAQIIGSSLYKENGGKVDFIVGGPPCQAYSMVVRHKDGIEEDDRCYLYRQYAKFIDAFQPMGFVFENVVGLKSAAGGKHYNEIQSLFHDLGYNLVTNELHANDYGVLQKRKRLIIFGWRRGIAYDDILPKKIKGQWTTKDIFSDLDSIQPGQSSSRYISGPTSYLKKFKLRQLRDVLTWHEARPLNQLDKQKYIYAIHQRLENHRNISYLEFNDDLQTMKIANAFTDRFKVIDPDGLSQTIVAHLSKDGHYYIYPSLDQVRSISVREAARLQSFPDNFFFEGSRSAAFKQIGNAVPPLLSEAIAKKVKKNLDKQSIKQK